MEHLYDVNLSTLMVGGLQGRSHELIGLGNNFFIF